MYQYLPDFNIHLINYLILASDNYNKMIQKANNERNLSKSQYINFRFWERFLLLIFKLVWMGPIPNSQSHKDRKLNYSFDFQWSLIILPLSFQDENILQIVIIKGHLKVHINYLVVFHYKRLTNLLIQQFFYLPNLGINVLLQPNLF